MKKTVVFEFPDNFEFPKFFEDIGPARCLKCPIYCRDDSGDEWCFLIGYSESGNNRCPFYDGADTINVN